MSDSIKRLYRTPLYKGAVELFGHVEEATDEITSLTARVKELEEGLNDLLNAVDALPDGTVDPHSVFAARAALKDMERT